MYTTESKKRRPRFSNAELAMLVNEVYRNKDVLFSKKCSTYSNEQKSRAWQAVTDSINGVCMVEPRTPEEVRRKWYYYLSDKKKETNRHKVQKKTSHASPNILYSPTDLKILEILGEIDGRGTEDDDDDDGVEGLICEVDADALPLRSPSSSSANGDIGTSEDRKILSPAVSFEELPGEHAGGGGEGAVNGFAGTLPLHVAKSESGSVSGEHDTYPLPYKPSRVYRRRQRSHTDDEEDPGNRESLHIEKRRLQLQECQLQVLQDIYRQMQEDSERNRAFQEAFLDIQRQRLDLKKESLQHQRDNNN